MTIFEASIIVVEEDSKDGTEKNKLLEDWGNSETKSKLSIAEYLVDALRHNNGKLSMTDIAFIFIFGIRIGQTLEKTKTKSEL